MSGYPELEGRRVPVTGGLKGEGVLRVKGHSNASYPGSVRCDSGMHRLAGRFHFPRAC
jgi:hypothetical protein